MNIVTRSRTIFILSGVYDLFLGIVFLFAPLLAFNLFQVTPPNHLGYVQFPAALLIVFAVMFFQIAQDPINKAILIPYGIMLKLSYSAIVLWYWILSDIPNMWKPFAIVDLLFMLGFIWCYYALKSLRLSAG